MSLILVNYIEDKSTNTFILLPRTCVLATEKIAILNTDLEIKTPLVVPINRRMAVVDKESYEAVNKIFHLKINKDGTVEETFTGGIKTWLPKDTNVKDLRFMNGELVLQQAVSEKKESTKEKPKDKKEN